MKAIIAFELDIDDQDAFSNAGVATQEYFRTNPIPGMTMIHLALDTEAEKILNVIRPPYPGKPEPKTPPSPGNPENPFLVR